MCPVQTSAGTPTALTEILTDFLSYPRQTPGYDTCLTLRAPLTPFSTSFSLTILIFDDILFELLRALVNKSLINISKP